MASRKPRGQRVIKPELPQIYMPGQRMEYLTWKDDKMAQLGYVYDAPIWTHDGFWEMDIAAVTGDHMGKLVQVLWNAKLQRWILKNY
jgi:hypothetical protein